MFRKSKPQNETWTLRANNAGRKQCHVTAGNDALAVLELRRQTSVAVTEASKAFAGTVSGIVKKFKQGEKFKCHERTLARLNEALAEQTQLNDQLLLAKETYSEAVETGNETLPQEGDISTFTYHLSENRGKCELLREAAERAHHEAGVELNSMVSQASMKMMAEAVAVEHDIQQQIEKALSPLLEKLAAASASKQKTTNKTIWPSPQSVLGSLPEVDRTPETVKI